MVRLSLFIAAAAFGSDVGWQPLPEGGTEYIIQLNPYELNVLRRHLPLQSDVPRSAGEVRAYRIVVGNDILPRLAPRPRATGIWPARPRRIRTGWHGRPPGRNAQPIG